MDASIVIAVVSGSVAVVSVVLSAVVTVTAARRNSRAQQELEMLKRNLDFFREVAHARRETIEKRVAILGEACSVIQQLRDDVRDLASIDKASEGPLLDRIHEDGKELRKLYQDSHFLIPPLERRILHSVKRQTNEIELNCAGYVRGSIRQLPQALEGFLLPLTAAQEIFIKEREKWNAILLYPDDGEIWPPNKPVQSDGQGRR
jgi:hypothetical protein